MTPCCGQKQNYLPITTGRVGLSQTTGGLEFYGHNYRGVGMGLFYGRWQEPCPPCPPSWAPPTWSCPPSGGCSCGGCGSCPQCCNPCLQGSNCFAQLLTSPVRWMCYYAQAGMANALTNPALWQGAAA